MAVVVRKIDNFIQHEVKIPKSVSFLLFFTELVCGIDVGCNTALKSKYGLVATLVNRCLSLAMIVFPILSVIETPGSWTWYISFFFQYSGYFIARVSSKFTIYDFFFTIFNIDNSLRDINFGIIAISYTLINIVSKTYICYYYCENPNSCFFKLVYYIPKVFLCYPIICVDMVSILQIVMFYYLYCCVKNVRIICERHLDIKYIQEKYFEMVNCFDLVLPCYSKLLVVNLILDGPRFMRKLYHSLFFIQIQSTWFYIISQGVYITYSVIHYVAPAVIVEMIKSETGRIKKMLHFRYLKCADEKEYAEAIRIKALLRFMRARPLNHEIGGIIPIDMRLPATLFSLCTTYIIVIIQMTHLYEK